MNGGRLAFGITPLRIKKIWGGNLRQLSTTNSTTNGNITNQIRSFFDSPTPPKDFTPPPKGEVIVAKLIGAITFFWIFYKFRQEGAVYLGFKDKFEGLYHLDYDKDYIPLARNHH